VGDLPSLSGVALQIGDLLDDPAVGAARIADLLRQDAGLSAAVLKLVNSSFYAIAGGVTDIARAISIVGAETLQRLVLGLSLMKGLRTPAGSTFDARGLWMHAYGAALCAEALARRIEHPAPGLCFTAGLLH